MKNYLSLSIDKKIFLFGMLSIVATAVVVVLFSANERASAAESAITQAADSGLLNNNLITAKIKLEKPVALSAILASGEKHSLKEVALESSFSFNNEEIQDFYVVDIKDKNKDIETEYVKNRKAFIADLRNVDIKTPASLQDIENISVARFTVIGKKAGIDGITKEWNVRTVEITDTQAVASRVNDGMKAKEARLSGDNKTVSASALTTTPMYLSVPKSGASYFYPSSGGGRYTQQNMLWNAINFTSDQTYEHKVYLYNYDRKTYLDGASTSYPGCYPTTTYAATNWPAASKPYLDTRLSANLVSCEIDELSYTIGAAQADALQTNTNYYTYIRTANGNDTSDKFKLQGQVGYRNPSFCYTTWCSVKYKIYSIIPSWSNIIPGTQSWTYNGQVPDAPSNVSATNPTATSLRVNFTDNTYDETNIWIERKIGTGGSWLSLGSFGALIGTGNWYWINSSLSSKTTYCYRLKATNNVGSSGYSNEACAKTL